MIKGHETDVRGTYKERMECGSGNDEIRKREQVLDMSDMLDDIHGGGAGMQKQGMQREMGRDEEQDGNGKQSHMGHSSTEGN